MRWYLPVPCSNTVSNPLICDASYVGSYDEWSFVKGVSIESWPEDAWFKAKRRKYAGQPDDVLQNYLMLPIFSKRLQQSLSAAGIDNIQYLPVSLKVRSSQISNDFAIANFLHLADALNLEKSRVSRYKADWIEPERAGQISGVLKEVLRALALNGFDVVRLKEYPLRYYVSERFKDVFQSGKFTGYDFAGVKVE